MLTRSFDSLTIDLSLPRSIRLKFQSFVDLRFRKRYSRVETTWDSRRRGIGTL